MKFVRFLHKGASSSGILDGTLITRITGDIFDAVLEFGETIGLDKVALLPPVVPRTFYAAGFNYHSHLDDHERLGYEPVKLADHPEVGYRSNNALIGHRSAIVRPPGVSGRFEAEGEVVAVIGKKIKHATRETAKESIFGWTLGNDVSAREWQHQDRTFYRAKNADTFKPMGPWIETDVDPMKSTTRVHVNGEQVAEFATGAMIFDPYEFIVEITKYSTLYPGDVLWMGAQGASAIDVGQQVEIEVSGIGTLSNVVVPHTV